MAFQGYLRQSTAVDILLGPFLDETNGKDAETGLTISHADVKLSNECWKKLVNRRKKVAAWNIWPLV